MKFRYELCSAAQRKTPPVNQDNLGFGALRTNHMFLVDFSNGEWHDPRIVPYAPISLLPGAMCLHYGQTLFEGAKAFRHEDGEVYLYRFDKNAERVNSSAEILCMPTIPVELQMEAVHRLLDVDREWCPSIPESSMYIRPFMVATEDALGVRPSNNYIYGIILSPSGPYYAGGFSHPIKLLISKSFHRAVSGGTGAAKAGGNYAASMRASAFAKSRGASQVLYLNAANTHVEEAGAMNHYHVTKDGTFIIPTFTDTILRSITSISVLDLAAAGKVNARQESIPLDKFLDDIANGNIIEAGGLGTAAVVSPVGSYVMEDGKELTVGDGNIGKFSRELYTYYSNIQTGKIEAPAGWLKKVERY